MLGRFSAFVTIAVLSSAPISSSAEHVHASTTQMSNACRDHIRISDQYGSRTATDAWHAMICLTWINGFLEGQKLANEYLPIEQKRGDYLRYCLPTDGIVLDMVARNFVQYVDQNPQEADLPKEQSLQNSLIQKFPCPRS